MTDVATRAAQQIVALLDGGTAPTVDEIAAIIRRTLPRPALLAGEQALLDQGWHPDAGIPEDREIVESAPCDLCGGRVKYSAWRRESGAYRYAAFGICHECGNGYEL